MKITKTQTSKTPRKFRISITDIDFLRAGMVEQLLEELGEGAISAEVGCAFDTLIGKLQEIKNAEKSRREEGKYRLSETDLFYEVLGVLKGANEVTVQTSELPEEVVHDLNMARRRIYLARKGLVVTLTCFYVTIRKQL